MAELSLKQLEVFAAVVREGSFTQAARSLYLTQSTVSAHIRALEQNLGGALFQRSVHRQAGLTRLGEAALPKVMEILEGCQALQRLTQPSGEGETLSLAASTVPAQCLLPALMAGFTRQRPSCRYRLQKGDSAQVHLLLERRAARIGFVGAILDESHCIYEALAQDNLVLVTANTPRFRSLRDQGILGQALLEEPMLCREDGSGTGRRFEDYLAQVGFDPERLHIIARIDQPEVILGAVESGLGVTVCSALSARERVERGRLLAFALGQVCCRRDLYLVIRREMEPSPLEQEFLRFAREGGWRSTGK